MEKLKNIVAFAVCGLTILSVSILILTTMTFSRILVLLGIMALYALLVWSVGRISILLLNKIK